MERDKRGKSTPSGDRKGNLPKTRSVFVDDDNVGVNISPNHAGTLADLVKYITEGWNYRQRMDAIKSIAVGLGFYATFHDYGLGSLPVTLGSAPVIAGTSASASSTGYTGPTQPKVMKKSQSAPLPKQKVEKPKPKSQPDSDELLKARQAFNKALDKVKREQARVAAANPDKDGKPAPLQDLPADHKYVIRLQEAKAKRQELFFQSLDADGKLKYTQDAFQRSQIALKRAQMTQEERDLDDQRIAKEKAARKAARDKRRAEATSGPTTGDAGKKGQKRKLPHGPSGNTDHDMGNASSDDGVTKTNARGSGAL